MRHMRHTLPSPRSRDYALGMRRTGGTVKSASAYVAQGWRELRCTACNGFGLSYAHRGNDPQMPITGMERCRACDGRGSTWRSPAGKPCSYPGGPFLRG